MNLKDATQVKLSEMSQKDKKQRVRAVNSNSIAQENEDDYQPQLERKECIATS